MIKLIRTVNLLLNLLKLILLTLIVIALFLQKLFRKVIKRRSK